MPDTLNRRQFFGLVTASAGAMLFKDNFASAKEVRPNIIYILADDMGFADLGCYGSRHIKTPHIDSLAQQGLKFTQAYANSSVCSPSRLALITGRYPGRLRVGLEEPIALNPVGLHPNHPTLPSLLQAAGYRTSLVGKWHLGEPPQYGPQKSGYEHFFGIHAGGTDYFNHEFELLGAKLGKLYRGNKPAQEIGYLTTILGQEAVEQVSRAANDPRPFMMSLHFTAPHWPWEGPEDQAVARSISHPMHYDGGNLQTYAAMMESMDGSIGLLLKTLRELDIEKNTLVIFSSDNGGERFSDVWPLIGMKGELLEGGIRVPLLMRWPDRIVAGTESQQVISHMDVMPSLLHLAGTQPHKDYPLDGKNLADVIQGRLPLQPRILFWRHKAQNQLAVRDGDWKYLSIGGNDFLFNLAEDQRERANLSKRFPGNYKRLKDIAEQWSDTLLSYTEDTYSQSLEGGHYADHY